MAESRLLTDPPLSAAGFFVVRRNVGKLGDLYVYRKTINLGIDD
jgi:hypothetical protein